MQAIVSLKPDRESFPVVDCESCGKRALVWLDVGDDGDTHRCLACNEPVNDPASKIVGPRAVRAMGYVFLDEKRRSAKSTKKSKCGPGGVRGCGTGGCSSGGSCGSGGGSCGSGGGCG